MNNMLLAFICHAIMDEQLRVLFIAFEKAIYGKYILSTVAGALKNIFLGQFVILSFFIMFLIHYINYDSIESHTVLTLISKF